MKAFIATILRGPRVSNLLTKLGIDPRRFWLLTDIFDELSNRGEVMDQLGRNGVTLKGAAWFYLAISIILGLILLATGAPPSRYLGIFIAMTGLLLTTVLLSETGNSLVNPTEGLILAHQPVNGATYTAAKLTHLASIILHLVPAIDAAPAVFGLFLNNAPWYYPLLHMTLALLTGLIAALFCCAMYGWLMRYIPMKGLKAAGQVIGTLPFFFMAWWDRAAKLVVKSGVLQWIPTDRSQRIGLSIAAGVCICLVIGFGLRSLSADYLIRVSSLTRGGSSAGASTGRSFLGDLIQRCFGGQAARAGYAFAGRMMLRDWQFRRQLLPMLAPLLVTAAPLATGGWKTNPFAGPFTMIHVVPHAIGGFLFFICMLLPWGADYKGSWIFHLAPSRAFFQFARGVHGLLWLVLLLIPHLILLALLAWPWGIRVAALFVAYSLAISSVYLGLELRVIHGIPFCRQYDSSAGTAMLPIMFLGGIAISLVVALQHFLLFRSVEAVIAATIVAGVCAFYLTRSSLRSFEVTMRHYLAVESAAAGTLYKEVNA